MKIGAVHIDQTSSTPTLKRNAIVVGAGTSIANAVLGRLALEEIRVLTTSRTLPKGFEFSIMREFAPLDLLQPDKLDEFAQVVVPVFGKIDIAIFLTGILPGKALAEYDDAWMNQVMSVNFTAQAALLRRLVPHFNEGALVLMMSSISGERGSYDPIYAASKAAQIAFVKSLATWLAPRVRVNAIAPALIVDSNMYEAMAPERRTHHVAQTPTRRLTTMEEIAGIIVDLCSPAWRNMNGQVIRINGGAHV